MSLLLKFSVCSSCNCSEIDFSELTGVYNASTNTTGYGTPNPDPEDFIFSSITITDPNGIENTIDTSEVGLPTDDTSFGYTITSDALYGLTDSKFIDGIYTLVYTIEDNVGTTYTQTGYFGITCNANSCKNLLLQKVINSCCDDCKSNDFNNYLTALVLCNGLEASISIGDITAFNKQLSIINKLCQSMGCNCN